MPAISDVLTRGYHTFSSYLPESTMIKAQVEILSHKTLQHLKYSAQHPFMRTAVKIIFVGFACTASWRYYRQLATIDQRIEAYIKNRTEVEQKALYRLLAPLHNHMFYRCKWDKFKNDCLSLNNDQFESFLNTVLDIQIADNTKDWISPLLESLTVASLRSKLGIEVGEFNKFMEHAKNLAVTLNNNSHFLREQKGLVRQYLDGPLNYLHRGVNSFALTFLRAYNFSPEENQQMSPSYARMHLSFYFQIIEKPYLLIVAVYSFLKAVSREAWVPYVGTLAVVVSTLALIKLLGVFLQNTSVNLSSGLSNLSKRAEIGDLPFIMGRSQEVVRIGSCLNPLLKDMRWVLLVGVSGSGKDAVVADFTKAVHDGLFPYLKKAEINEVNTVDLKDIGGGSGSLYRSRLELLRKDIEGKEEKVVVFLNEIHTLTTESGGISSELGNQLKTLSGKKIMFIGATTLNEFKKTLADDPALLRRFEIIFIEQPSRSECVELLRTTLNINYPNIDIEEGAIEKAYDLTNSKKKEDLAIAQPDKAKKVLDQSIGVILSNIGKEEVAQLVSSKTFEKERIRLQSNPTDIDQANQTVAQLESFGKNSKKVHDKQVSLANLENLYRFRSQFNLNYIALAFRVADIKNWHQNSMEFKKFILFQKKLALLINRKIAREQDNLEKNGMHVRLTKNLVGLVVKENQSSRNNLWGKVGALPYKPLQGTDESTTTGSPLARTNSDPGSHSNQKNAFSDLRSKAPIEKSSPQSLCTKIQMQQEPISQPSSPQLSSNLNHNFVPDFPDD